MPHRRLARYAVAIAIVGAATLARAAVDPLIHAQIPYFIYVASIAVATRLCGVDAGILATLLAAFTGNYFFVDPRGQFLPDQHDWIAIAMFCGVSFCLVWFIGRGRRAEAALERREEELRTATLAAEVGVWAWAPATGEASVGANWRGLFGVAADAEVTFATWAAALHRDDRARAIERLNSAWQDRSYFSCEYRTVRPDGSIRWIIDRGRPTCDSSGNATGMAGVNLDITERKQAEDALRRSKEFLDRAQEIAHLGSWELDLVANHLSWSDEAYRIFGLRPQEFAATYEAFLDVVHPDDRAAVNEAYAGSIRDGRDSYEIEHRVVRRDTGEIRVVHEKCGHVRDADGRITRSIGMTHDITERKETEQALRDANRLKDEFVATLSHELRTPLNAIVGWSDMLRRGNLKPAEVQVATESIFRNAKVQSELIADVLDVSRIISGKVRIEPQPMDLAALLNDAMESVRAAADAKRVTLMADVDAVPFPVSGDSTRMQQVFWNLLSNAVKFTPSGGTVGASLRLMGEQVRVQVTDTGIGITADFLPHVFERFRQHDSSSTRMHGGLGLGLAIVRHLVELHGGSVVAESAGEGKGATFTVTLPAARFEERRHQERGIVRPAASIQPVPDTDKVVSLCGCRVLVVDDERDARHVTASVLKHYGASVAVAENGEQAMEQFERFDPHVLLVDVAMPGMDGYALIKQIRTSGGLRGATVPAIAFTAYAREQDARRAIASGFQLHLAKPVDSDALVRAIAHVRPQDDDGAVR